MDWNQQAQQLLSEGIVGNHVRADLLERIARLLQIEAELQLVSQTHTEDIAASPTPNFDARVASHNTVEELVKKYRDVCGALVVAAEEAVQEDIEFIGRGGEVTQERVNERINGWLTQAQQRQVLAMMPKDGKVH